MAGGEQVEKDGTGECADCPEASAATRATVQNSKQLTFQVGQADGQHRGEDGAAGPTEASAFYKSSGLGQSQFFTSLTVFRSGLKQLTVSKAAMVRMVKNFDNSGNLDSLWHLWLRMPRQRTMGKRRALRR